MNMQEGYHFDVLVVGRGTAGMAAAACAAECGVRVGIVDDNPSVGGQIWRHESTGPEPAQRSPEPVQRSEDKTDAAKWAHRLRISGAVVLCGLRVVDQPEEGALLAEGLTDYCQIKYEKLVLATGARERFLPFPGWTLPNVMGAGGLQAMVKGGLPIRGKRVLVAGTGPLLLAVAAYLRKHGAEIPLICEQSSWSSLARFGTALVRWPNKIAQSLRLKKDIAGISFVPNSWPLAAHGEKVLEAVTISH